MSQPFTRLQAALTRSGIQKPDGPFDDEQMRITCPACGTEQTLGQTPVHADGNETYYRCKNGCQNLVIVVNCGLPPSQTPSGGQGYFLARGPVIIKNGADLIIPVGVNAVKFPPTNEFPR